MTSQMQRVNDGHILPMVLFIILERVALILKYTSTVVPQGANISPKGKLPISDHLSKHNFLHSSHLKF